MNTTDKLAEALRRCEQVIREACEEDPGKWDWAAINADEGAQAREALAAHERAQAGEPVVPYLYVYEYDSPFGLNREFYPRGWNGQKPTRTVPLYTTPPAPEAQRREPLTVPHPGSPEAKAMIDSELALRDWPANTFNAARAGYEACRKLAGLGIGATTGKEPANVGSNELLAVKATEEA